MYTNRKSISYPFNLRRCKSDDFTIARPMHRFRSYRNISYVISGANSSVVCNTKGFGFTCVRDFELYIEPFLIASKDVYPLTTKSTINSTLLMVLYYSLVFPLICTTSCYDFIHSNGRSYPLPAGICKILEYICVKTLKYSTSESLGSVTGAVVSPYQLKDVSTFLKVTFLNDGSPVNSKNICSDNIQSLSRLVSMLGYTVEVNMLISVLSALVIELDLASEGDRIDFDRILTTISRISTSLARLKIVQFMATKPNCDKVGIYKFRNSGEDGIYYVTPKGYESMSEEGKQITFIFLSLFKPVYVTNGISGTNLNAEDLRLDICQHSILDVTRALFSYDAESVGSTIKPVEVTGRQTRSYSTMSEPKATGYSGNNPRIVPGFGSHYSRYNIWCTKPLVLSFDP